MRVLFSPCGIGFGHIGRLTPLAKSLVKRKVDVLFSTYGDALKYARREGLPTVEVPPIDFRVKEDGSIDLKYSLANPGPFLTSYIFMRQLNAELNILQYYQPDIVISDTRASSILASRFLGVPSICILNQFGVIVPRKRRFLRLARLMDYGSLAVLGKIWTSSNKVLIPDFPEPYTLSEANLYIPKMYRKNVKLIGPILPSYPHDLEKKDVLRRKLGIDADKTFIFAPISGPVKEKIRLIKFLMKSFQKFPERFVVVMSIGDPSSPRLLLKRDNLSIYGWMENRFECFKACDAVLARAGHETLIQSVCYGKPAVLIPTPNHTEQLLNAKKASDLGFATILNQERLTSNLLLKGVKKVLSLKVSEKIEEVRCKVQEFNGLERTLREMMDIIE